MTKCQGIRGKLFGHSYEEIYEDEQKGLSAKMSPDEIKAVLETVCEAEKPCDFNIPEMLRDTLENLISRKDRFIGIYCPRCGDYKKHE